MMEKYGVERGPEVTEKQAATMRGLEAAMLKAGETIVDLGPVRTAEDAEERIAYYRAALGRNRR